MTLLRRRALLLTGVLLILGGTPFVLLGPASPAFSAPSSVTQPSVSLSSSAAGASAVTYTVGFTTSATGAIPAGGSITLIAPSGTVWPTGGRTYAITDATTPSGSNSCVSCSSGAISVADNGAAVTMRVDNAVNAGDALSLSLSGASNPGAGSFSLQVSTSADTTLATSASYTITAPSSVTQPSVSLSSSAAGASAVTYTVGFTTSATGAIPAGGSITLIAPSGTVWPTGGRTYAITDATTPSGSNSCVSCSSGAISVADNGAAVTMRVDNAVNAGDALSLSLSGASNPGAGSFSLQVSTSADTTLATSASYTITAPSSVTQPSVSLSSSAAGASAVTYTVGFTTSATGAIPAGGSITLIAPSGTVWPTGGRTYAITDATTPSGSNSCVSCSSGAISVADNGAAVTMRVDNAVNAGDALSLSLSGASNPGAGSFSLQVSTSADTTLATSASYTITAPSSVTQPSVSLSSSAAGASAVTYTVGFTTSATGAIPAGGSITLIAPSGTVWPTGGRTYAITDATTPSGSNSCVSCSSGAISVADNGAAVTMRVDNAVNAGDALSLSLSGASNPGAGSFSLQVSTSADTTLATSASYTITGSTVSRSSVASPSVALSTTAAGASGVTYAATFTTSSTGALVGGSSSVTLAAPVGTVLGTCTNFCSNYSFVDHTNASGDGAGSASLVDGGSLVSVSDPSTIQAGDSVTLSITGVTNPPTGDYTLDLSTSSDTGPVALTDSIIEPQLMASPDLTLSTTAAGASGVTYAATFTTSSTGALVGGSSSVTLAAPVGTVLGTCTNFCSNYSFVDHTNASGDGAGSASLVDGGSLVSVSDPSTIQAGDSVTLSITGVTNPPTGDYTLDLSTSSDTGPVALTDSIIEPQLMASPDLTLSTTAAGASGVTYAATFTTSSTGALVGGSSSVTLAAPVGTVLGTCTNFCSNYSFVDHTNASGDGAGSASLVDGGSLVSVSDPSTIQAGDSVTLSITGVRNAQIGPGAFTTSTSSDPIPTSIAKSLVASRSVTSSSLTLDTSGVGSTGIAVSFTTSPTGTLVGGSTSVTLAGPVGSVLGTCTNFCSNYSFVDHTNSSGSGSGSASIVDDGSLISVVDPNTIQAGDNVTLSITGVMNPPHSAGALAITTSSDFIPAEPTLLPSISGTVSYQGNLVSGAPVQACSTSGACASTTTSSSGVFQMGLAATGQYSLTAFPTASLDASSATVGPIGVTGAGTSGVAVVLSAPPGLTPGVSVDTGSGTQTSATVSPRTFWLAPFEMQISPTVFPQNESVIATELVIEGTDATTGLPATKIVPIGGSVDGIPIGVAVGAQPITVTVPPLYPIHGQITTSVKYSVAPGPFAGVSPQPYGLASTQILDLIYPPASSSEQPTDPLPAYFLNLGDITGAHVGGGSISGPDASEFAVVPLSSFGVPPGSTDCGAAAALLQPFDGVGSNPPPSTECGVAVRFTPPSGGTRIYYRATLDVPVHSGASSGTTTVALLGCDANVAAEAGAVDGLNSCFQGVAGESSNSETTQGPGDTTIVTTTYTNSDGTVTSVVTTYDADGNVIDQQTTTGGGSDGSDGTVDSGGLYVDPSGTVLVNTPGGSQPLAGATVTLEQGARAAGPFSTVPNGSAIMSPANRANPDSTDAQGSFGWDVLSGFYQIVATHPGCSTATSAVLTVPPPVTGLVLTLTCSTAPTRLTTATGLTTSASSVKFGSPITLTARITGTNPTGSVTFHDGPALLGSAPVVGGSVATLAGSSLTLGSHSVTATYNGDGDNKPSMSTAVTESVVPAVQPAAPRIVTTSVPDAKVGHAYQATVVAIGGKTPYQWSVTGHVPAGLSLNKSTGIVTGTPSAPGLSKFKIHLTDSSTPRSQKVKVGFSIQVIPSAITISPAALPSGRDGAVYRVAISASGGNVPYAFIVSSGRLPPGLTLASGGSLRGKPTATGISRFTVTATDKYGNKGRTNYLVGIN